MEDVLDSWLAIPDMDDDEVPFRTPIGYLTGEAACEDPPEAPAASPAADPAAAAPPPAEQAAA